MLGLDASGKTTIAYAMRHDNPGDFMFPSIGWNAEIWKYNDFEVTCFDLGGQDKIRILHRHYYSGAKGLVYVIDSADRERLSQAREELYMLLAEKDFARTPLLVMLNKQDLPGHMAPSELAEMFELDSLFPRPYHVQPTCATLRHGLSEAFDWLKMACNAVAPCERTLHPMVYSPGEYVAHTRLQVIPDLADHIKRSGFVEAGTTVDIEEVRSVEDRHYGFVKSPVNGWVFIASHGSGEHVRQHDRLVSLTCTANGSGGATVECHSLAGDDLAVFSLDESLESVAYFRAGLAARIGTSGASLKVVMPNGELLPRCGSKELLLEALMLEPVDVFFNRTDWAVRHAPVWLPCTVIRAAPDR
jgi:GTPase SAR1 family protein